MKLPFVYQQKQIQVTALIAVCLVLSLVCGAVAQEDPQPNDPQPGVRRVYVPVDQLDAILAKNHNGVILPNDKFKELFELATKNTEEQPRLPALRRTLWRLNVRALSRNLS